jgi:hypothetical protein
MRFAMSPFRSGGVSRALALALLLGSLLVGGASSAQLMGRVSRPSIDAELVRRSGGEWVIVDMAPTSAGSAGAASQPVDAGLGDALGRYQRALELQDIELVARVWVMNPAERAQLQSFFDRQDASRVSLDWTVLRVDGDHAVVRFVQQLWSSSLPSVARFARARGHRLTLSASDAVGTWSH